MERLSYKVLRVKEGLQMKEVDLFSVGKNRTVFIGMDEEKV